jgi:hypothetical protein
MEPSAAQPYQEYQRSTDPEIGAARWRLSGVIHVSWFSRLPLFEPRFFDREDRALAAATAELARVWRRLPESDVRHSLSYSVELEVGSFAGDDWRPSHSGGTAALDPATGSIIWRYRPRGQRRWPLRNWSVRPSY